MVLLAVSSMLMSEPTHTKSGFTETHIKQGTLLIHGWKHWAKDLRQPYSVSSRYINCIGIC